MQPCWRCLTAVQICNRCADIPTLCTCSTVVEIFDLSTLIRNSPTTRNISLVFTFIKRNDDSFSFQRNSVCYQQNKPNRVHIERKRRFFYKRQEILLRRDLIDTIYSIEKFQLLLDLQYIGTSSWNLIMGAAPTKIIWISSYCKDRASGLGIRSFAQVAHDKRVLRAQLLWLIRPPKLVQLYESCYLFTPVSEMWIWDKDDS